MLLWTWVAVGAIGLGATAFALRTPDDAAAIITGTIGAITWGVWTYGSLNIQVVTQCCVRNLSYPSVTLLGLALSLIPMYIALTGPTELVDRARDTRQEDL